MKPLCHRLIDNIIILLDLDEVNENECVKKENYIGFAHFYLSRCNNDSKSDNQIDKELYTELIKLDRRLGVKWVQKT